MISKVGNTFLQTLDKLEQEKYPYRPSIAACFVFSELLGLTYDKQGLIKNNSLLRLNTY